MGHRGDKQVRIGEFVALYQGRLLARTLKRWCERGELPDHCFERFGPRGEYRFWAKAAIKALNESGLIRMY